MPVPIVIRNSDQLLMLGAMMCQQIDEGANLGREVMAMRVDRIHRQFHRPIFRQQANQSTGFEVVVDQKTGNETNRPTLQGDGAQRFPAIGDQIT
jgi:hypothetical protein